MKTGKVTSVNKIVTCSLLASLTAMLQISAGLFPGPGNVLAGFSTLPIALATYLGPSLGVMCTIIAAWLTLLVQPAQLPVLALGTAPLGIAIGWGLHHSAKPLTITIAGTICMSTGMTVLAFGLGFNAFWGMLSSKNLLAAYPFFCGFSFIYSAAWLSFTVRVANRLSAMGVLPPIKYRK